MNHSRIRVALPLLAALLASAAILNGCGSGSGSSGPAAVAPGTITGQVLSQLASGSTSGGSTGTTGAPVQNLKASIDGTTISTSVSPTGAFTLPPVPPGNYNITVHNADGSLAGHCSVQIGSGTATQVSVELLPAGQVAGIVRSTDNTGNLQPVGGVAVTLTAASDAVPPIYFYKPQPMGNPPPTATTGTNLTGGTAAVRSRQIVDPLPPTPVSFQLSTTSASDGTYQFPGVPAGFYQVTATQGSQTASSFITVSAASTTSADLTLTSNQFAGSIQIYGTVTGVDLNGQTHPIAGATVQFGILPICGGYGYGGPAANGGTTVGGTSGTTVGTTSGGSAAGGGVIGGSSIVHPTTGPTARQQVPMPINCPVLDPPGVTSGGATTGYGTTTGSGTGSGSSTTSVGAYPTLIPLGATTDANGQYKLTVPVYAPSLVAFATNYLSESMPIPTSTGSPVQVNFQLQADPLLTGTTATLSVDGSNAPSIQIDNTQPPQPVNLTLTLMNTSSQPISLPIAGSGDTLFLVDPNSGWEPWNIDDNRAQPEIVYNKTLQPGESFSTHETFPGTDDQGNALSAGKYYLQGTIGGVNTNQIPVTVTGNAGNPPPVPFTGPGGPLPPVYNTTGTTTGSAGATTRARH